MASGLASTRCVFVGDPAVGKTSVIKTYLTGTFTEELPKGVYDSEGTVVQAKGTKIYLSIGDCSGDDTCAHLRRLIYQSTDLVVLCFSLVSQTSMDNVTTKWWPEVKKYCPNAQVILLGTKSDLQRTSNDLKQLHGRINNSETVSLMNDIKAMSYLECSSLLNEGLKEIFEIEIPQAFQNKPEPQPEQRKRQNCILQ